MHHNRNTKLNISIIDVQHSLAQHTQWNHTSR